MKNVRRLAFWILPLLLAVAVVNPFVLSLGDRPMGERVAAIVLFLVFGALIQGILYRVTSRAGS